MKQMQLKNAALTCKQKGDLQAAKEYLTLAHRMDQMVIIFKQKHNCSVIFTIQSYIAFFIN
jgi:hypothetical protein